MANFLRSIFAALKEPFPAAICNCLLDAYVHPRDIPVVIQYMKDFTYQDISLSFGNTDNTDRNHIEVKFRYSEWTPNEIVDSFFIYQDDLQRLIPNGDFVFSIQDHHVVPSFSDIIREKYRTFLSRWTRHRMKVSKRWKSGNVEVTSCE